MVAHLVINISIGIALISCHIGSDDTCKQADLYQEYLKLGSHWPLLTLFLALIMLSEMTSCLVYVYNIRPCPGPITHMIFCSQFKLDGNFAMQ